jgi:hypothetical protein
LSVNQAEKPLTFLNNKIAGAQMFWQAKEFRPQFTRKRNIICPDIKIKKYI